MEVMREGGKVQQQIKKKSGQKDHKNKKEKKQKKCALSMGGEATFCSSRNNDCAAEKGRIFDGMRKKARNTEPRAMNH